jgi:hypothetical protein
MSPRKNDAERRLAGIEAVVCRDVGRGTRELMAASSGSLAAAAQSLATAGKVGLITGFFVPRAEVPAAETDGPVGSALLAAALTACGVPSRIAVDTPCAATVRVAVETTGAKVAIDEVGLGDSDAIGRTIEAWRRDGITHAIAIERCGRSADGKPRNMRGADVSPWTAPLEDLYQGADWKKVAIGDGGNEIGMGSLPAGLVARTVANGAAIACVVPCDHLIVAGVSNWGAYGLMAALGVVRPDWNDAVRRFLRSECDLAVTRAIVAKAGAVDGVTARPEATVDGLAPAVHATLMDQLRRLAAI